MADTYNRRIVATDWEKGDVIYGPKCAIVYRSKHPIDRTEVPIIDKWAFVPKFCPFSGPNAPFFRMNSDKIR